MRYESFDWYADARYYDIIFDLDTQNEADFLEAACDRYGRSRGRRVLEPACGSGRLVVEMTARRWRVTGFDAATGMLDFARARLDQRGLRARLVEDRLESFELDGPFDLAHNFVSTFKYLLHEKDARAHLRRMADVLAPGGIYLLGLHLTDYSVTARQRERWVAERDGTQVVCNIQSWPPDRRTRRERVRSRLRVTEHGQERGLESEWIFRTYDFAQLKSLLAAEPRLELVATHGFDVEIDDPIPFDGEQADNVLVLRRR